MSDLEYILIMLVCIIVFTVIVYDLYTNPHVASTSTAPAIDWDNIIPTNTTNINTTQNTSNPFHLEERIIKGDLL